MVEPSNLPNLSQREDLTILMGHPVEGEGEDRGRGHEDGGRRGRMGGRGRRTKGDPVVMEANGGIKDGLRGAT